MASSGEVKGIDASVGGLVWVRRRNGSWWPGKILGLDELSESCLVSPRSGTPVKLLGREDASIDWYNLEKSKRVKAFRCGEYDECIEKAKASAANSCKKAVKYARREDAILHALELESAHLGKDQLDFSYRTQKNASDDERGVSSESLPVSESSEENGVVMSDDVSKSEDTGQKKGNSEVSFDSAPECSQSDIHLEEESNDAGSPKSLSGHNRRRTPNDSEDDGTEGVKRMRGLEDLGVGLLANRRAHDGGQPEVTQPEDASLSDLNAGNCVTNGNPVHVNMYSSSLRRKRTQVASVQEFLKRKNRRRPLTKVLESTAMVSVPVICDQLPSTRSSPLWGMPDSRVSGLDPESKKSNPLATINSSDGAAVSCDNEAALSASDASRINCKVKENEVSSISGFPENNSSDKLFDVPFIGEEKHSAGFSPANPSSSSGRSPVGGTLRRQSSTPAANEVIGEAGCTTLTAAHDDNISQTIEGGTSKWQLKGKRNSRHLSNRRQDSRKYLDMDYAFNSCSTGKLDCNNNGRSPLSYSSNLQARSKKFADGQMDGLCDWSKNRSYRKPHTSEQNTEVKQSLDSSLAPQKSPPYRRHSRFTVHSRYQMTEFSIRNSLSNSRLFDVELEVKASYRPQHVPLVSLMSKLNGKAIVGHPLTVEIVDDGYCDSLLSRMDPYLEVEHTPPAGTQVKQACLSPSKSPKTKRSGQLCKKIRKLSSLTGHNRHEDEPKQTIQKSNGHDVVACIPIKVVFSRINEAVSGLARPSTKAIP